MKLTNSSCVTVVVLQRLCNDRLSLQDSIWANIFLMERFRKGLTHSVTCRRPTVSFRVHSKPQADGGQVERWVRWHLQHPSLLGVWGGLRRRFQVGAEVSN